MTLILTIDTALETGRVCVCRDGLPLASRENTRQVDHASWVHSAIGEVTKEAGIALKDVSAVAVSAGPGSYTGLRVGMATAKGLCYALGIPMVPVSTLMLIASAAKPPADAAHRLPVKIVPMIDARRMEVFTAIFDSGLQEIAAPRALILDENSFKEELNNGILLFCGNGSPKWRSICIHPNAVFSTAEYDIASICHIASQLYVRKVFADLAYAEPFYLKNAYTGGSGSH